MDNNELIKALDRIFRQLYYLNIKIAAFSLLLVGLFTIAINFYSSLNIVSILGASLGLLAAFIALVLMLKTNKLN
ncbi:hypothetical protein B4U84_28130 [Westiellopsis prolifica IICB1]|nr:hypothetical protein B4U84_28130 [Westiellopsis prolifica IICB1]BAZ70826.1 hypothetical protein NIES4106_56230 [Fischerella sp. NIES-4106]